MPDGVEVNVAGEAHRFQAITIQVEEDGVAGPAPSFGAVNQIAIEPSELLPEWIPDQCLQRPPAGSWTKHAWNDADLRERQ